VCLSCASGYYASITTANACTAIPTSNCLVAHPNGTCVSCSSGYYVSSGGCVAISSSCSSVANAEYCISSTPTTCNPGYHINNSACSPCLNFTRGSAVTGCAECDGTTANLCVSLGSSNPNGYYCYISNGSACAQCSPGYYPGITGACTLVSNTISNCLIYASSTTSSTSYCYQCQAGYIGTAGSTNAWTTCSPCTSLSTSCTACTSPCLTCSMSATNCTSCLTGYLTPMGTCASGTANSVQYCSVYYNSSTCAACDTGYYFAATTTCKNNSQILIPSLILFSMILYYLF